MKFTAIFTTVLASASAVAANPLFERAPKCNADNCARAITGTAVHVPTTALADCKSFMQSTMTPSPIWKTVTLAHPVHIPIPINAGAVTVAPTAMPAYAAAACSTNSARYVSACACGGATPTMLVAPTPTYVKYVTPDDA